MTTSRVVPENDAPARASGSSFPIALDSREHTIAWVALREREAKLLEQAAHHESLGNKVTVRILTKLAGQCRELTDRLDEARFGKKEASNAG
jgi:hypothetical protein